MKKNWRKVTSGLMALVMCLSVLMGIGTTTAFAAGENANVYMVSFPRDGDANYGATWGHSNLQFKNGWHSGKSRFTTVRAMNSYDGNICYCIEIGVSQETGDGFTNFGEDFWDHYPSSYNDVLEPDEIKSFIGRIFQYGYTGTISTSWRSQNSGADNLAHAYATQLLIWETVIGERDSNFNHAGTNGCNAITDLVAGDHPLRNQIFSYYNYIVNSVQNHTKIPSFMEKARYMADTVSLDWDGTQYKAILEDRNDVVDEFSFSSSDCNFNFEVQGNSLIITTDTAPVDPVTIQAARNGLHRRGVITWTDGVYGPDGRKQDTVTYAQEVSDPVTGFVKVKVDAGSAKIIKTSEDGKIEGITFNVSGNGINTTVQTGADGTIQIDNLMPGVYTVTEQSYDRYEPQEIHRVTVVAGQVTSVNFNNVLKRGSLSVTKISEDGQNASVKFHLCGTSLSGIPVDQYAVTNDSGVAMFEDVLIGTGYTLEEVDTAIRYVVPENQAAAIEWNKVAEKSVSNVLKKFNVTVTKSDAETGIHQGDASLAGAAYGIYKGEQLVDTYYTDENGQFTTNYYICGDDWSIREIEPSEGYLLDANTYHVGAEAQSYTVELNSAPALDVTETVIKGNIAIIKHTDNGETQIETPEEGAVFQLYQKSSGSFEAAKDSEKDTLTCDENGFAQSKDLPYGVYTVHQVSGWEGRELMKDFDVFVAKNGEIYRYLINNANFESFIKVIKVDAETGMTIPYAGAGFQIYRPDGSLVSMKFTYPEITEIDTFYTNEEGMLITPEKLEYGKGYKLVEVSAPYGYVLSSEAVSFDVTEDNSTEEGAVRVVEVKLANMAQKGVIRISKCGEVFATAIEADGIFQPVYKVQGLAGAVYEITAAEDIYTLDGTLRFSQGEVVDTVTTDDTGTAESKALYLGKYAIKEIEAPHGMVINNEIHTAELVYAGQEIEITETEASFCNDRQKVRISLSKIMEQNEQFGIGMNGEFSAVTFGFYAAQDLTAADGTVIPADGLIEIVSLDENGNAVLKSDVPFGSYYVKEISTDKHYLLSDQQYPVTFEYQGQDTATVELKVNDGNGISNKLIYGEIHGMKKDKNGIGLGGASIGLFTTDGKEPILTTVSADDGSFSFKDVPYGEYVVREIAAPEGYVMDDTPYSVNINANGAVVEIEITNTRIYGSVQLTKVDKDYPDHRLAGAEFEVYKDGNLIGKLEALSDGIYKLDGLEYGDYTLKETKAPEGF